MEFVNEQIAIPVCVYIGLEQIAKNLKLSTNEIILYAILGYLSNDNKGFNPQKNARFDNTYNEI